MKGWTKEEIEILKENYVKNKDQHDISQKLKRSWSSIRHKGKRLRLSRPRFKSDKNKISYRKEDHARYYQKNKKQIYLRKLNRVNKLSKELKIRLGGKCSKCSYSKSLHALDFHHLRDKENEVSRLIRDFSREKALKESEKCILLCANCHRELHNKGL